MVCTIQWSNLPINIWEEYFQKVNKSNLLQSYKDSLALPNVKGQTPRWALLEIDGVQAGLFQILETGFLGNMIHAVILDRGPLWFDGFGSEQHFEAFIRAFRSEFPRRFGRRVRFIPETQDSPQVQNILKTVGFRKTPAPGYQTMWLNLERDEDTLRANLVKKWRNTLTKAEKQGMSVEWDEKGTHFEWLMKFYSFDKKTKGYSGPSVEFLRALAQRFAPSGEMLIGRAMKDGRAIGAILLFCHGRSSTYQIGWNTREGRDLGAHNLLLWDALKILKNKGITGFDLGGVNDTQAQNVKKFKQGLGGDLVTLPGLYT